ncbi:DUF6804 family protein [Neomicrococcus lactis]|uniref:Uncharacterized protein n=1 Tax=Neomicrococcus lactis TaxID=732241 RepID=A0A7W8Y9E6_9MICC|nr:DUF6804 family protein [Neomicrococcus lactis]MBB5597332.1 hypothetical protein [Neomicrococcus lactis]
MRNSPHGSAEQLPPAPGFIEKDLTGVPLRTVHPAAIPAAIGGTFMLIAWIGAPNDFYALLRWVITAMAIWTSVIASRLNRPIWMALFIFVAILFNPISPVYATREFWAPIDFIVMVLFCFSGFKFVATRPAEQTS